MRILRSVPAVLFPEVCLLCGEPLAVRPRPAPVCRSCVTALPALGGNRCSVCSVPLVSELNTCTRCRQRSFHFQTHTALLSYRGAGKELMHQLKFAGRRRVARLCAALLAAAWTEPPRLVIPVPARGRRLRTTGFDPVGLTAAWLGRDHDFQIVSALVRQGGRPQKALDFEGRSANVRGRISARHGAVRAITGCRLLILDDVFTTGATLDECARVLTAAGAAAVQAATVLMEE